MIPTSSHVANVVCLFPHHVIWLFLVVGVLGGFTTFSTFGLDFLLLVLQKSYFKSFLYVAVTVVCGLLLTALGFGIGKIVVR